MKSLILTVITSLLLCTTIFAQEFQDEQWHITGVYHRQNIELRLPNRSDIVYDKNRDSIGVNGGYNHFLEGDKKTGRRGIFGIGIEAGVTFHNGTSLEQNSKVALYTAHGVATLQARNNKTFQPYIHGGAGFARSDFGGLVLSNDRLRGGNSTLSLMAGAGFDLKKNKSGYGLRTGFDLNRTSFGKKDQYNFKIHLGVVFN